MSTRKRRPSPSPLVDHQRSKRARLLSDLWPSHDYDNSSPQSQTSGETVYTIRAIIGEKPGEYLIDWAEDRFTGETYPPDWVSTTRSVLNVLVERFLKPIALVSGRSCNSS